MPAMASCASARHHPPVDSASSAKVMFPPSTGLAVVVFRPGSAAPAVPLRFSKAEAVVGVTVPAPPLPVLVDDLLLLPHAASTIAETKTMATAAEALRLPDLRTCLTGSPK